MKWQYLPKDRNGRLAWLAQELAEASVAIATINRFGAHGTNPEQPEDPVLNPKNVGLLLLEMWDVEMALRSISPDVAQFLGEAEVSALRAHWESKAFPPAQGGPTGPTGSVTPNPTGPVVACGDCNGMGFIVTHVTDELKSRSRCGTCEGLGRVPAARVMAQDNIGREDE